MLAGDALLVVVEIGGQPEVATRRAEQARLPPHPVRRRNLPVPASPLHWSAVADRSLRLLFQPDFAVFGRLVGHDCFAASSSSTTS